MSMQGNPAVQAREDNAVATPHVAHLKHVLDINAVLSGDGRRVDGQKAGTAFSPTKQLCHLRR